MSVLFLNVNFKGNDQLSNALDKMNNAAKKLNDGIKDTQKHLASLSKMQLKVSSFEKLKQETSDAQKKLESYKKTAEALKQQLAAGGKNPELTNQLKTIEKEAKKLQGTVDKNTPALKKMRQELNNAGLSGMSMADAQRKLKEDIEATTTAISKQQTRLEKFNKAQDHYDKMKGFSGGARDFAGKALKATVATGTALAVPVKFAIDAEKSMADVAKVVDGLKIDGKVTAEYKQFERQMTEMSNRLGMQFADLSDIIAGGAQGGIKKNELMQFGEHAVKTAIAWGMEAGQVGQAVAELRSTLKLSQNEVATLSDQINYLGNSSTNNAAHILEVVQRVGSVGAAAGVSGDLIAAMGASISGIDPSSVGTGLKNIIKSLTKGDSATKSQRKAWEALGTTAEEMASQMLKDPEKAITRYLEMLGKLPEEQRLAFASMISGDEALPVLAQMMNDPEKFARYAAEVKDGNKINGSVDEEYNSAVSTTAFRIDRAKVKMQNLAKDFGKQLLPFVSSIADAISGIVDKVSAWAAANPELFGYLAKGAAILVGILAGVTALAAAASFVVLPFAWLNFTLAKATGGALTLSGAFKAVLNPVSSIKSLFATIGKSKFIGGLVKGLSKLLPMLNPIKSIPAILGLVKSGFMVAAGAVKAFTVGLLTSPIGLISLALVAAAVVIYKYWKPISAFFKGVWSGISEAFAPIKPLFESIGNFIKPVIDWFKSLFSTTQAGEGNARQLGHAFGVYLVGAFKTLTAPIRAVWSVLEWVWDGISNLLGKPISVGDIFGSLREKWEKLLESLDGYWQKAQALWDKFTGIFKKSPSSAPAQSGEGGGFWSSLISGFGEASQSIGEKMGSLWDSAGPKLETAKTRLTAKVSEIWSSVTNVINGSDGGLDIAAAIGNKIQTVINATSQASITLSSVFAALINVVGVSAAGMISIIGVSFSAIPAIVSAGVVPIPVIFAAALGALPKITAIVFSGMAAAASAGMSALALAINSKMQMAVLATRMGFIRIIQTIASSWRQMGSAMSGNPILSRMQSAIGAVLSYLNGVKGRFFAIGADIVRGLDSGMKSQLGTLRKTATQIAAVVENAARQRLDTHSPSRVMALVGRDVVAGLDVGMKRRFAPMLKGFRANIGKLASPANIARVSKAVSAIGGATGSDNALGDLARIFAPKLSNNPLIGFALSRLPKVLGKNTPKPANVTPIQSRPMPLDADGYKGAGGGHASTSNYTIHIHASPGMDERTLAKLVQAELERYEQRKAAKHRARMTD